MTEAGRVVLITGATGNVGGKLTRHFRAAGYPLRLLCLNQGHDPAVQSCDLSVYDEGWASAFAGVDTVLHAAADPSPWATWDRAQRLNLDLLLNVMAAAHKAGVRRVVFASSNFVVAGHRFGKAALTAAMPPFPINAYGTSKLVGERVGKMFAERYGLSFIAFRIGVCQRGHDNRHGSWIPFGRWGQEMWVSDRDLCAAFQAAVDDERVIFAVYNLVSNNPGMRWEVETLRRDLGFVAQDGALPKVPPSQIVKAGFAWLRDVGLPGVTRLCAGKEW